MTWLQGSLPNESSNESFRRFSYCIALLWLLQHNRMNSGQNMLAMSFSEFDPEQTSAHSVDRRSNPLSALSAQSFERYDATC